MSLCRNPKKKRDIRGWGRNTDCVCLVHLVAKSSFSHKRIFVSHSVKRKCHLYIEHVFTELSFFRKVTMILIFEILVSTKYVSSYLIVLKLSDVYGIYYWKCVGLCNENSKCIENTFRSEILCCVKCRESYLT